MKRILARNEDIAAQEFPAEPSSEQYSLFRAYLDARHQKGGMSDMTVLDYAMMVEDTHVPTRIIEYRLTERSGDGSEAGRLAGVTLSDLMGDGISMVYSFFDPNFANRSLGTYMILDHITRARDKGLPHVYLGYWVAGSRQDGLQDPLPAAGPPDGQRLGALHRRTRARLTELALTPNR